MIISQVSYRTNGPLVVVLPISHRLDVQFNSEEQGGIVVEYLTQNQEVLGSIPSGGTVLFP